MSFQGVDPIVLAVFVGALSLMPMLLIVCTAFLKIVIVLMITRNAIGVQQVPPSMAINGIALAATLFIMAPVGYEIAEVVKVSPLDLSNVSTLQQTGLEAVQPLRTFMVRNSDPDILTHLLENTARMWPPAMAQEVQREDLILLIPAYVLSQLQAGFEIGFLIYIPFIVIDLIVSNLLLALGMQMVSPMTISLPLKLLLFVMVSGWSRLLDSLFLSLSLSCLWNRSYCSNRACCWWWC
ncbi:type III secretion system export apparatus subunit SctR [Pseudomonas veronii]|uniref:Type III secretion system export apparatus subunit SctR n=1 Tax=Pseudomonas veronii TaxID=76761 RepID=A0A4P7Y225_PSEVE|nr:type III secretion system export apparatus subunit SctR [Pseudomonas veronii]